MLQGLGERVWQHLHNTLTAAQVRMSRLHEHNMLAADSIQMLTSSSRGSVAAVMLVILASPVHDSCVKRDLLVSRALEKRCPLHADACGGRTSVFCNTAS